jgi:spore coat protein H
MKKLFLHIIFLSLVSLAGNPLGAQQLVPELGPVFVDTVVPRVDILIPQDSLDLILAPGNEESNQHFLATFIFDNGQIRDTLQEVGFRLRGNTSRHSAKKSFKVSFNTFVRGREYHGLEKLNLNGEHNDPSIIRSKLCWDLFRQAGIPAPRANHVKLYINGSYKGLYINVEHIDEEFVRDRFGNREGNLYKCTYPADLDFISNNPNDYRYETFGKRPYELHTNTDEDDYSDLAEFIQVLNQTPLSQLPCELEKVFNVHRYLKTLAVELLCGHWDNYAFLKNNFYLYHNAATGQFEYIPYDTDNTFGIDWFGNNWATRDLYNWSMPGEPRPLYTRLLDVPAYRAEFSFYVRQLTPALYSPASMFDRIDSLRDMIASSAQYDVFRTLDYGYNYQDFLDSYDQALGAHVTDGLKPFITTRSNTALSQVEISNMRPAVSEVKVDARGMPIFFQALIEDEVPDSLTVTLHFRLDSSAWQSTPMFDDGNHQDGQAQDGIWGGGIQFAVPSATIQYKIEARDKQAQTGVAPPCQALVLHYHPPVPNLVINEVMARNDQWAVDEYGEWEDWIEIYNADTLSRLSGRQMADR